MKTNFREAILQHFPANKRLAYDDFICSEITDYYYQDEQKIKRVFELISCPWIEIQWHEISKISFNWEPNTIMGYLVIPYLNEKSFVHVFPSLLAEIAENESLTADYFLCHHLDIRSVFRDWELEFYFSFNEDVMRLINLILRECNSRLAMDAIDVYWHESGERD